MKRTKMHGIWHRSMAAALSLSMMLSMCDWSGLLTTTAYAAETRAADGGTSGVTREADPSTMDTYTKMLDFSENTRYAGRLWSDKSVFALDYADAGNRKDLWSGEERDGNIREDTLTLTPELDGVTGDKTITLDEDFLHVYSALGSSLEINEGYTAPIDLAIIIDMSGSMGQIVEGGTYDASARVTHSRIGKTVIAVNEAIDYLMKQNEDNRVTVVAYGGSAYTLLPLGHYKPAPSDTSYITVRDFTTYSGDTLRATPDLDNPDNPITNACAYTLSTNAMKQIDGGTDWETENRSVRNNYTANTNDKNTADAWIGYQTDMTAGIYLGFQELYKNNDVTVTYTSMTGERKTLPRIPVAFVMTDGGTNVALKDPTKSYNEVTGTEWYDMHWIPDAPRCENYYDGTWSGGSPGRPNYTQNPNWLLFQNEADNNPIKPSEIDELKPPDIMPTGIPGGPGVLFHTLMSASYMTTKVQKHYKELWDAAKVENSDQLDFIVDTIGVDLNSVTGIWEQPRMYASMDPKTYFQADPPAAPNNAANNTWFTEQIQKAYGYVQDWYKHNDPIPYSVETAYSVETGEQTHGGSESDMVPFKKLDGTEEGNVTNEDVLANIYYVDEFRNIESGNLTDVFKELLENIETPMFTPVSGSNDLGVEDAVTYMDPVGKYMDVKDVKNLLLFGELYDITKTAVYDYQWNHQYMVNKYGEGTIKRLDEGWYTGEPTADNNDNVTYVGNPTDLPTGCDTAQQAWDAGWVYRLNYTTASQFVPTLASINNDDGADETITKMRHTEYTFYRIADDVDRTKLHLNPAYLDDGKTMDDEEEIIKNKKVEYNSNGEHLKTPGVYALSDLRIWVEDSGDFNDTDVETGGVQSDANFDEALWVNIPINMLPLRTVSIDVSETGETNYTTNLTVGSPAYKASFPLRVFYTVGVSDEVLENNRINIAGAIDAEYILQNKITDTAGQEVRKIPNGVVEFFSNWYNPLNRYDAYATTNTDYTFGDPVTTFSPAVGNRYYIFEKALPLYRTAYVWVETEKRWRRVSIEEDLQEGSADDHTFSATGFGGKLIAVDLDVDDEPTTADDATEKINGALEVLKIKPDQLKDGDMVLLHPSRMTDVKRPTDEELEDEDTTDPFSSDGYYFLPIEYYELGKDGHATWTQYVITRKGSEFGSAYESSHITNGDMLCWHDMSGENPDYPYLSYTETSEAHPGEGDLTRGKDYIGSDLGSDGYYKNCDKTKHDLPASKPNVDGEWEESYQGDYVLCAKPGGLRVGNLAQSVQSKGGDPTKPEDNETIKEYYKTKYKDIEEKIDSLTWTYYKNNVTRTANNYYVPTISNSSDIENDGVRVNVYLGNNGRLYVEDTTLLVTKDFEDPEGLRTETDQKFNYQVYLQGITGTLNAIVVRWNERSKSWQRQLHYIDLELDSQRFLQTLDGNKAMVDSEGRRVVNAPGGEGYVYADNLEESCDEPYYVYIDKNSSSEESISAPFSGFRVYHNNEVDQNGSVSDSEVSYRDEGNGATALVAKSVLLVSLSQYTDIWQGEALDPNADGFEIKENYGTRLEPEDGFTLLTIDPNISDTTDISVDTPYRTASSYWTKQVTFGVNANDDGDGKEGDGVENGAILTADDLYDGINPSYDYPNFKGLTNDEIAKNTAEFTLGAGEALLFSGLPSNTYYRVTEKLTEAQMDAGYSLKELRHNQQVGSVSTYRPGVQSLPVYYNVDEDLKPLATYGEYGSVYPASYENFKTEKGLMWSLGQGNKTQDTQYLHYEPFHHTNAVMWEYYATMANAKGDNHHQPPTVEDGESTFWLWDESKQASDDIDIPGGVLTHDVLDNPSCKPLAEGGCDEEIGDNQVRHYMFKDGEMLDQHYQGEGSGYIRNIARYLVTPTVRFGVNGETQTTAETPMPNYTPSTDYSGVYSAFGNTGTFEESTNFVNTIHNDKTETQINGEDVHPSDEEKDPNTYPGVQTGDTISYEMKWHNSNASAAEVTVTDRLDPGVDFEEASYEEVTLKAEKGADGQNVSVKTGGEGQPEIAYDKETHTVTWKLGSQEPGTTGVVKLTVRVNENAKQYWDYEPSQDEGNNDYKARNRAHFKVGENEWDTNTVVNPVGEPDKTETAIERKDRTGISGDDLTLDQKTGEPNTLEGPLVYVGDRITYQIKWRNYESKEALVTVRDPLDENVRFISASFDPHNTHVSETASNAEKYNPDGESYHGASVADVQIPEDETGVETPSNAASDTTVNIPAGNTGEESQEEKEVPVIQYYADSHVVMWNLGFQPAGAEGTVTLVVEVLSTATPVGYVRNTAYVKVNGDPEQRTNTVENPTPKVEKTEPDPGDGERVLVNQTVDYKISWDNRNVETDQSNKKIESVTVIDPLDPGVDFVSASYQIPGEDGEEGELVTLNANEGKDTDKTSVTMFTDGLNNRMPCVTISYDAETHTVTWVLKERAAVPAGSVDLKVLVTERAFYNPDKSVPEAPVLPGSENEERLYEQGDKDWTYRDNGGNETDEGQRVQNRGAVRFNNDAAIMTDLVENPLSPMKEEIKPGDGVMVKVGEEIHYRIHWQNYKDQDATVTVVDPLDPGVDFMNAVLYGKDKTIYTLNIMQNDDGYYAIGMKELDGKKISEDTIKFDDDNTVTWDLGTQSIKYDKGSHTVTWDLGEQAAYVEGYVDLHVRVNENAVKYWQYDTDENEDTPEKDLEVVDRAGVQVNGDPMIYTDVVENPVPEKTETEIEGEKGETEVTPEDNLKPKEDGSGVLVGPSVYVGDTITYEIAWKNGHDSSATVTITDPLDPGVDFVGAFYTNANDPDDPNSEKVELSAREDGRSCSVEGYVKEQKVSIRYRAGEHTVIWELSDKEAGSQGVVTLKVKVNENAEPVGRVDNRGYVRVNDEANIETDVVENPTGGPHKEELTPGNGAIVQPGDRITYKITWENDTDETADIRIIDLLDKGVKFISATMGGTYYDFGTESDCNALRELRLPVGTETSSNAQRDPDSEGTETSANAYKKAVDKEYASSGLVYWLLKDQPAGEKGEVYLTVEVLDTAMKAEFDNEKDGIGRVFDRAAVSVGNRPFRMTEIVENPTRPEKTEQDETGRPSPGDGETVKIGQEITYEIKWRNDSDKPGTIIIKDPLDIGVDFVEAYADGYWLVETGSDAARKHEFTPVIDVSYDKDFPLDFSDHRDEKGDKDGQKPYEYHGVVVWTLKDMPAGAYGSVFLTVRVNKNAETEIRNQAVVQTPNASYWTNIPENPIGPSKTEVEPGDGVLVKVGEEITYEISWRNPKDVAADVEIIDRIDKGLTFVSASDGGHYHGSANDENRPETDSNATRCEETYSHLLDIAGDDYEIDYADHGLVHWLLKNRSAGAVGKVTLKVEVNDKALTANNNGHVYDQAAVRIDNDPFETTNEVENPTWEPHKTETKPGNGHQVEKGDEITYQITWRNFKSEKADVTVIDLIDIGADFVSASNDGVYYDMDKEDERAEIEKILAEAGGEEYEKAVSDRYKYHGMVRWILKDREPGDEGYVELTVKVNERAIDVSAGGNDGRVYDRAAVRVGNDSFMRTEEVENPTKPFKSEIKPGDGELIHVGDPIEYKITWQNTKDEAAEIVITDELDTGLDYVDASATRGLTSDPDVFYGEPGTYNKADRTITWTLGKVPAGAGGYVTFMATVNENAASKDSVINQATVKVDHDPQITNKVENPTKTGNLQISKVVSGGDANDRARSFTFTVKFTSYQTGRELTDSFEYTGSVKGTIKSGESLTLKHGQRVQIKGIPAGTKYEVTESDNEGFTVSVKNGTGEIVKESAGEVVAAFTNSKGTPHDPDEPGNPPGNPRKYPPDDEPGPGNPGNPDNPSDNPSGNPSDNPNGPDVPTDHVTPKTGDTSDPVLWLSLLGFSLLGIFAVIKLYRKKDEASKDGMQT